MTRRQSGSNVTFPDHIMHNSKLNYKQNFTIHRAFSLALGLTILASAALKHSTGTLA